jgi:tetrahydromethanopterin S-methyltransferase subunit F
MEADPRQMTIRGIMISMFFAGVCMTMHLNEPKDDSVAWLLLLPVFIVSLLTAVGALVGNAKEFALAGVAVSAVFAVLLVIVAPITWLMRYALGSP